MDPASWGPQLWSSLHYIALGYPENPSALDKRNYKAFYESLDTVLPCDKCAQHYKATTSAMPIDPYLDSASHLFEWTVAVHNVVNARLGKPQITVAEARQLYIGKAAATSPVVTWAIMGLLVFLVGAAAYMATSAAPSSALRKAR